VLELQGQLQIMLQSVNTDLDFSLGKSLSAYVGYIPSKQDIIYFMNAEGLTNIGILEGTQLVILSCSWNLIQVCFLLQILLLH